MAERTPVALRTAPGPQAPDPPHVRTRGTLRDRAEARTQRQCTAGRTAGGQVALPPAGGEVLSALTTNGVLSAPRAARARCFLRRVRHAADPSCRPLADVVAAHRFG